MTPDGDDWNELQVELAQLDDAVADSLALSLDHARDMADEFGAKALSGTLFSLLVAFPRVATAMAVRRFEADDG